jgi:hypothetical protein
VSTLTIRQTDLNDMPATLLPRVGMRSTALLPVLATGIALLGGGVVADQDTRATLRYDIRRLVEGTSIPSVHVNLEPPPTPFQTPTRMARIRALAPLSYREWGPVFGVTHSAIKQWADSEPEREKLDLVLTALDRAAGHRADLSTWLLSPLPGMQIRPLDLLREDRWRAFEGALRARPSRDVTLSGDELVRRRRDEVSWDVSELPIENPNA